jgi:hypothetical protein
MPRDRDRVRCKQVQQRTEGSEARAGGWPDGVGRQWKRLKAAVISCG